MAWPPTWLPALSDFAAGELDEHRSRLDALALARRDGVDGIVEFEEALDDSAPPADVVLVALLLSYRAEQAWDRLFAVVERMPPELAGRPFVQQQHAFALNRAGRDEEAQRMLLALREEHGPSPETSGILGRVRKDRFLAARETGDQDIAEFWLRRAIDSYLEGHDADPSDPYPGLNAVSLMEFASPRPARRDALVEEVSAASRRRLLGGAPRYWDYATEWELAIIAGDEETARVAMGRSVESLEEPWQAASTRYNTRMLEAAWASRGVKPPGWFGPLAGRLDSAEPPDEPPPSPDEPPSSPDSPPPPDEPPPPSGPPAGAAEALPDLPDFVAGDREEHRARLDALVEARALGVAGVVGFEETLDDITSAPDVVVTALMLAYRAEQAWDDLFALVERMRPELAERPFVHQQHAFALNRAGRGVEAEEILLALRQEHGPSPETNGILGRVYKDWFRAAQAGGDEQTAEHRLRQAIDTYLEGHDADPSNPYPGVNALTLMELAEPRPARSDALRDEVSAASRRRLLRHGPGYWDYATEWELAVLAGDEATAGAAMERATARVEEPWQAASTSYNTHLIQDALADRGQPVPEWLDPAAARLDAVIPSGAPPEPSPGPPVPATPRDAAEPPSAEPGDREVPPATSDDTAASPSTPVGEGDVAAAPTDGPETEAPPDGSGEMPVPPIDTAAPEAPPSGDAPEAPAEAAETSPSNARDPEAHDAAADTSEPETPPSAVAEAPDAPAEATQPEPPPSAGADSPAEPTEAREPEAPSARIGEAPDAPVRDSEAAPTPAEPTAAAAKEDARTGAAAAAPGSADEAVPPPARRGEVGALRRALRRLFAIAKFVLVGAAAVAILGAAAIELLHLFGAPPFPRTPLTTSLNLYSLGVLPGLLMTLFLLRGVGGRFRHALALWLPLIAWVALEAAVLQGSLITLPRRHAADPGVEAVAGAPVAWLVLLLLLGLLVGLAQAWWLRRRKRAGAQLTLAEHYKALLIGLALAAAFAFLF